MAPFPSNLKFAALLKYSTRGTEPESKKSQQVMYCVKNDKPFIGSNTRVIVHAATTIQKYINALPYLKQYFNPNVTLVPFPRSAPLVTGGFWISQRICDCFVDHGLAAQSVPCLERVSAVNKSATAKQGERPTPLEHFNSLQIKPLLKISGAITVVDDVVTRGSSFLGAAPHFAAHFPGVEVQYFAILRAMSGVEVDKILDPVEGKIIFDPFRGMIHREP